ncbi:MAG: hypothetical protein LBU32_12870 [Clostridiales bacterium]|jgi:hypothetical protein|nr:hypothetical protein [Clostridiales bacterium]
MRNAAGKRNLQIHKAAVNKGGKRKLNQSPKYAFCFQLFDGVLMPNGSKASFSEGVQAEASARARWTEKIRRRHKLQEAQALDQESCYFNREKKKKGGAHSSPA